MCRLCLRQQYAADAMHYVFRSPVRLSVRPLTSVSQHDTISPYLVEGFEWNFPHIFVMWVSTAEKVFKVRGQRSRSWPDELTYNGGSIHFDGVASMLILLNCRCCCCYYYYYYKIHSLFYAKQLPSLQSLCICSSVFAELTLLLLPTCGTYLWS